MWNNISERCTGLTRSGGKAHLFEEESNDFKSGNEVAKKTKERENVGLNHKNTRVNSQRTVLLPPGLITAVSFPSRLSDIVTDLMYGLLYFRVNHCGLLYFPTIRDSD